MIRLLFKVIFLFTALLIVFGKMMDAQHRLAGRVIRIIDGDTFELLTMNQETYRIRMQDIDCPERGQDYYRVAKQALSAQINQEHVDVIWSAKDRNNRILGRVFKQHREVNLWMVQQGYAWHYKKYSNDLRYKVAERQAKSARKGLWVMPQPIAPWAFRQRKKS